MTSSLYRDLRAGRGTEVEQILGDLIRRARAFGVATPLLDLATLALRVHQQRIHNSSESRRGNPGLQAGEETPLHLPGNVSGIR
jgi:hypothetical protein